MGNHDTPTYGSHADTSSFEKLFSLGSSSGKDTYWALRYGAAAFIGLNSRYDHRLRQLVYQTGDYALATRLGVPRSTAAGWVRFEPLEVVSFDILSGEEQQLQAEILKLRQRRMTEFPEPSQTAKQLGGQSAYHSPVSAMLNRDSSSNACRWVMPYLFCMVQLRPK